MTSFSTALDVRRGRYGEIVLSRMPKQTRRIVENLIRDVQNSKVDEHGWEFGAEFDEKGRGSALNQDVYGIGRDIHSKRFLVVLQVRQYIKQNKNYFPTIRKSYFLIGRNEDNTAFAHCVPAQVVHSAIRNGKNVVYSVQSWIFGADYKKVLRQGDIGLIPVRSVPRLDSTSDSPQTIHLAEGSHILNAEMIAHKAGITYALNPYLQHVPQTHPDISAKGWFKVVMGSRAKHYSFAPPTID